MQKFKCPEKNCIHIEFNDKIEYFKHWMDEHFGINRPVDNIKSVKKALGFDVDTLDKEVEKIVNREIKDIDLEIIQDAAKYLRILIENYK